MSGRNDGKKLRPSMANRTRMMTKHKECTYTRTYPENASQDKSLLLKQHKRLSNSPHKIKGQA